MSSRLQLFWFVLVGGSAFAVHYLLVLLLVGRWAVTPLHANVLAFCCAFWVSYFGHRRLTFQVGHGHRQTLPRFALVSLSSFAINQLLFALLLLELPAVPYYVSLAIVLVAVAILTFLISKFWAFAHDRHP